MYLDDINIIKPLQHVQVKPLKTVIAINITIDQYVYKYKKKLLSNLEEYFVIYVTTKKYSWARLEMFQN